MTGNTKNTFSRTQHLILIMLFLVFPVYAQSTENISFKKDTSMFGGIIITQTEIDKDYPCYLESDLSIFCPAIDQLKLNDLGKKYDISKGIPIKDQRVIDLLPIELKPSDQMIDPTFDNKIYLNLEKTGDVHIGFNSNVFTITSFTNWVNNSKAVITSQGISVTNNHIPINNNMTLVLRFDHTENATNPLDYSNNHYLINATGIFLNQSWIATSSSTARISTPNIIGNKSFTFCAWVRIKFISPFDSYIYNVGSTTNNSRQHRFYVNSNSTRFTSANFPTGNSTPVQTIATSSNISLNVWHYVCDVINHTGNASIYVDGSLISTAYIGTMISSPYGMDIISNAGNSPVNASIDEVIVWNKTLTTSEINYNYIEYGLFDDGNSSASLIYNFNSSQQLLSINCSFSSTTQSNPIKLNVSTSPDNITWSQSIQTSNCSTTNLISFSYLKGNFTNITALFSISSKIETPLLNMIQVVTDNCTTNWACNGYGSCNSSDRKICNSVNDLNNCGYSYSGNYEEFPPQICDFCIPSFSCNGYGSCNSSDRQPCNNVTDLNNCFSQTGISNDSYSGNFGEFSPHICDFCIPNFICSQNNACNPNGMANCTLTSDTNVCFAITGIFNDSYSGNFSEFNQTVCDYCIPSFSCSSYGNATCGTCVAVIDSNNCYAITNLTHDQFNESMSLFTRSCSYFADLNSTNGVLLFGFLIVVWLFFVYMYITKGNLVFGIIQMILSWIIALTIGHVLSILMFIFFILGTLIIFVFKFH